MVWRGRRSLIADWSRPFTQRRAQRRALPGVAFDLPPAAHEGVAQQEGHVPSGAVDVAAMPGRELEKPTGCRIYTMLIHVLVGGFSSLGQADDTYEMQSEKDAIIYPELGTGFRYFQMHVFFYLYLAWLNALFVFWPRPGGESVRLTQTSHKQRSRFLSTAR